MPLNSFLIDKITNSIEEVTSGKKVDTVVQLATADDIKGVLKKDGWNFNWKVEYKVSNRQIFKLLANDNPQIQG